MAKTPTKPHDREESGVLTRAKPKTKKPSLYKVLLLNDDYTPMEFVVMVLEQFFSKNRTKRASGCVAYIHLKWLKQKSCRLWMRPSRRGIRCNVH
jgi:ATP-dependent Clp protease adaptor protein ClpS